MSCKNILKKLSLLKGDENFFHKKKFGGGSLPIVLQLPVLREKKPLRLQKLSFLNPPPLEGQELFSVTHRNTKKQLSLLDKRDIA